MRHAVLLYLDEESEAAILGLQRALDAAGLPTPLRHWPELRPHITLASYLDVPHEATLIDLVRRYAWAKPPLGIRFESLGIFLRPSTVLFLSPDPSLALLKDHEDLYDQVDRLELPMDRHYAPDSWTPHCTISEGMRQEQLVEAVRIVAGEATFPLVARARAVGIIKVEDEPVAIKSLAEFPWGK
jgi:2'-5' RNA ligase